MVSAARLIAAMGLLVVAGVSNASARPPTAQDVLTLRELGDYRGGLTVSPDGTRIAVFERELRLADNDYRYRLLVMPSSGGPARVIADAGDMILRRTQYGYTGAAIDRAPAWSPDSRSLAYVAMRDGHVELWRVNVDAESATPVATGPGDVLRFAWLDANTIIVETTASRETITAIATRETAEGFHPDDNFTPYAGLNPAPFPLNATHVVVLDLGSGRERAATPNDEAMLNGAARPQGAIAGDQNTGGSAWIAPRTPGDPAMTPRLGLYHASEDSRDMRMCDASACTQHMLDAWIFGDHVVFRRMEGWNDGLTALYGWDWARNSVRLIRREDEELFGCGRAGARLVCLQESPTQPRRIVSIDIASGEVHSLYDPNPQWRSFDAPRVERFEVHDAFGNQSFAHLVFPAGYVAGRRYPVVIVQYRSRGFLRGGVGDEYPIYPIAGRGYFVLSVDRPEWRGADANTLTYDQLATRTELDNSENAMKQSALVAMLDELDRRGLSDPHRIGITGMSDGAETVYWAITRSDLFAAAVASNPPTDPTAWTLGAPAFRQQLAHDGTQGPDADPASPWGTWWRRNSTVLHAESIHAPLLMNLPESEALMGFPLATRLAELHRPVDVYVYPGAYHVKWRPVQVLAAQDRAMDWLDFWLRGIERDDPDDLGRLARWRALRASAAAPR